MLCNNTLEYLAVLEEEFKRNANAGLALKQEAYMRHKFKLFGMATVQRRVIQSPFMHKAALPPQSELHEIVHALWTKDERDFHYFAQELALKYMKRAQRQDIALYEYMVTHQSWWDTVDLIANKLMGNYFILFPDDTEKYIDKWLHSDNIWLQRSSLLFQLKYKDKIDTSLLSTSIHHLLGSDEFFINKAIGWVLREYSRTNAPWVEDFVMKTPLSTLSAREAMRLIKA